MVAQVRFPKNCQSLTKQTSSLRRYSTLSVAGQPAICPGVSLYPDNNNKLLRGRTSCPQCLCSSRHCHSVKERHASRQLHHGSTETIEACTSRSSFWMGYSNGRMNGGRLLPSKSPPLGALPHPVHIHG